MAEEDTKQPPKGDEIGPLSREDEQALDRAWSRITPADIARSKERLRQLQSRKRPSDKQQQQRGS